MLCEDTLKNHMGCRYRPRHFVKLNDGWHWYCGLHIRQVIAGKVVDRFEYKLKRNEKLSLEEMEQKAREWRRRFKLD